MNTLNWFSGDYARPVRLDPDALGLEGRELEIARIIADETEARRDFEKAQIPPETEPPKMVRGSGLLGSLLDVSEGDSRRSKIDALAWDELFTRGDVHGRCVAKTGLDHSAVASFALDKCRPLNFTAFFWYAQWVKSALHSRTKEEVDALISAVKDDAARRTGQAGADERWAVMRAATAWTQERWAEQKEVYKGNKSDFARGILGMVKQNFQQIENITERTIRERWLKGK